jgi:uncharacterized protein YyaL (SSP411 family)
MILGHIIIKKNNNIINYKGGGAMTSKKRIPNRLVHEKSPYLLQHAYNPVDWFPWSEEAFAKAKSEDKPVFLSIGYSTCHWCHVMEREVFEKHEAASILNDNFVNIKVDREERPDIDHIYMEACQAMTGRGGWPLTIFMTPDKKPFFCGTYFPLTQFKHLISTVIDLWENNRGDVLQTSETVLSYLSQTSHWDTNVQFNEAASHKAYTQLYKSFDTDYGGFGSEPKFPSPHTLMFLKRYAEAFKEKEAARMAEKTLVGMFLGGIFDHIGGGFCRYSTDRKYLIPHFEKMLYDNAMLAIAYTEAGMFDVGRRTLDFCMNELWAPEGAFYTALDADSEGVEGKFYLFTPKEIESILGPRDSKRFCELYDITNKGNFEGSNIPNLIKTGFLSGTDEQFASSCRQAVYKERSKRIPPARDEKILLSSNSLMISALSIAGRMMGEKKYITTALAVTDFIRDNMLREGRLYGVYREGLQRHPATSDDYAYFAWALYNLHQSTLDDNWLEQCKRVCESMMDLFMDDDGLLWLSGNDVTDLPLRAKNTYDGALPAGVSIAAEVFLKLYLLGGQKKYHNAYQKITAALAAELNEFPTAHTALLSASLLELRGGVKVELPANNAKFRYVLAEYHPFAVFRENSERQNSAIVCTREMCLTPVTNPDSLSSVIDRRAN